MNLGQKGYRVVDIPPATEALLESFNHLPVDQYSGSNQRFHRFSQYRLSFRGEDWHMEKLPHRPLIQSSQYNTKSGDIMRHFPPVQAEPTVWISAALKAGGLDTNREWHLDINQYRVTSTSNNPGICVPEGAHQDGHHYVMIFVFKRQDISGAVLKLLPLSDQTPFFKDIIQESQAIIIDDTKMKHDATPISAIGEYGYRDYFGTALNPWEDRRYGDEFERRLIKGLAD